MVLQAARLILIGLDSGMKIAVVGGGAAGLAAAKVIKESEQFKSGLWSIHVFEERNEIGGTW